MIGDADDDSLVDELFDLTALLTGMVVCSKSQILKYDITNITNFSATLCNYVFEKIYISFQFIVIRLIRRHTHPTTQNTQILGEYIMFKCLKRLVP